MLRKHPGWTIPDTPFFTPTSSAVSVIATYPTTGPLLLNGYIVE